MDQRNFTKITVYDLCNEALVSRATFYMHFNDKYDLLRYWLTQVAQSMEEQMASCKKEEWEKIIKPFIQNHRGILTNIAKDPDGEVMDILSDFFVSIVPVFAGANEVDREAPSYTALLTFCTGGLLHLLRWQVKKNFPLDDKTLIVYVWDFLHTMLAWNGTEDNGTHQRRDDDG
jgi:AcrR family transcriptional regulator